MPSIYINKNELFKALGRDYTQKEFEDLCFDFGLELDGVTIEGTEEVYKIDIPANRYDILCLEGLARSLRIFLEKEDIPHYKTVKPETPERMIVLPATTEVRQFVVCAVLRNVTFDQSRYDSFIELQDKLHQNICRKRTLVSIGTHDLDTIKGPFTYDAKTPESIVFAPLNSEIPCNGAELMTRLEDDAHLRPYLPIIRDKPKYPVIYDSNNVVLSLPPIINGNHSKITLNTKNVFIEVTGTDYTKSLIVLNTVVCMFAEYCEDKFSVEQVEIQTPDGEIKLLPDLSERTQVTSVEYITSTIGLKLTADEIVKLLKKMCLRAEAADDGKNVNVAIPPTRSDVLHSCDVMEDVAIGYGFNNLTLTVPKTVTVGKQQPINKLTDLLRLEVALAGYTEILTLSLCSIAENFTHLNRKDDGSAVKLANPKTIEYQVGRTSLLPGLLKTIYSNQHAALPIRIFEISDVILKDDKNPVGARNERRLCAMYYNKVSAFEVVHGLLDRLMLVLGVKNGEQGYSIVPSSDPAFFPGRQADVILCGKKIGIVGILHPDVIVNYELNQVCSVLEITIEPFLAKHQQH
eukprot:TRINITY_DN6465_c0_g8_i1.p1 TRINITY_DN6465_c0_g8~~TRINITY_DN6465_c0_g8_i1.p1  ORF type:complete len:576 (+),score=127.87 TRINITY_DN6465_c0_g8_i1:43-1770(+)